MIAGVTSVSTPHEPIDSMGSRRWCGGAPLPFGVVPGSNLEAVMPSSGAAITRARWRGSR